MIMQVIETDLNQSINRIISNFTDKLIMDLKEPEILIATLKQVENAQTLDVDYTLASGISGLISFHSQINSNSSVLEEYGYKMLVLLNQTISEGKVNNLSLWGGLTGIAASVYLLSDGKNYSSFVSQLNDLILENINLYIQIATKNLNEGQTTSLDFETVYGLAGIARYLLILKENKQAEISIKNILEYFIRLNETVNYKGNRIPRYFITMKNQLNNDSENYPGGHLDLGMAHGICGPLSIMALAIEQGYELVNLSETLQDMADELVSWVQKDEFGIWWPSKVNYDEYVNKSLSDNQKGANGWCYGTPGVARALWICGRALKNEKYKKMAVTAYRSLSNRNFEDLNIISPTFCHGLAGLIHLTHLMYIETLDDDLSVFKNQLITRLLNELDEDSLLGFEDVSFDGVKRTSIGSLDGISGIYMVLQSILIKQKPTWSFIYLTD